MEAFLNSLTDESQRLFFMGVISVIILAIALVLVIFMSQIKSLKDRLFDAKEIDMAKNNKIATLQKSLAAIEKEEISLRDELYDFNDTKVSLKSKKELIFKMQERMNILEEKEKLHLEKVDTMIKDFQTLSFKYKGMQKRNEFLVEENSRIRKDYSKLLLKVSHQERRIFEKLTSLKGKSAGQHTEVEKLAEPIYEKNHHLFDALRHEAVKLHLSPLSDEISHYQKELIFGYEKSMGKERDLQLDIVSYIGLYQKMLEDIDALSEKLKEEDKFEALGEEVLTYVLKISGIDQKRLVKTQNADEEKNRLVFVSLPNEQNLTIDTNFSMIAYESYRKTMDPSKKEEGLSAYMISLKAHIATQIEEMKKQPKESYCWMLIPHDEALSIALKQESRLCDQALKKHIVLVDPTMLLSALQSIIMLWDYKHYYQQADVLGSRAEEMYEQFVLLGGEMSDASQRLAMLQESLPFHAQENDS